MTLSPSTIGEREQAEECAMLIASLQHGADLESALAEYKRLMEHYDRTSPSDK